MAKKVAVLVRERQEEGLRVAVGLTLVENLVEVFVLDCTVARTPSTSAYLAALREIGSPVSTTCAGETDLEQVGTAELARRIIGCDHILPY